jgi:NAD(P)-dependent dehydrogenase (short-subunit alcohol dehydrogenase family)
MRLAGKVALITGGSTGIGRAIALRFAAEGCHVVIADINDVAGAATAEEAGALYVHCNTADAEACKHAVEKTVSHYGKLDILVASAAHLGGAADAGSMTESEWRAVMSVTLDGVFHACKYAVQAMGPGGSIVNIASVEGMNGAANHVAYVTGKSAIFGLTRSMAIDFGKRGIRVNAISPGIIDVGRPDQERLKQLPHMIQFWQDMTVLDRMGKPEEIASAALFLASDEASYVTGHNLVVDGGWTIGHSPVHWPAEGE